MGCVAGDPTSRGARPGGLPRTSRHGARSCAVPQAGLVRFGTGPGSTASMFLGPPKPHDVRSASPDIALRTPLRPGRAPQPLSGTSSSEPSAKWGVHILHIEIVFAYFAYCCILYCIFRILPTINNKNIKTCILVHIYLHIYLHILHIAYCAYCAYNITYFAY